MTIVLRALMVISGAVVMWLATGAAVNEATQPDGRDHYEEVMSHVRASVE